MIDSLIDLAAKCARAWSRAIPGVAGACVRRLSPVSPRRCRRCQRQRRRLRDQRRPSRRADVAAPVQRNTARRPTRSFIFDIAFDIDSVR